MIQIYTGWPWNSCIHFSQNNDLVSNSTLRLCLVWSLCLFSQVHAYNQWFVLVFYLTKISFMLRPPYINLTILVYRKALKMLNSFWSFLLLFAIVKCCLIFDESAYSSIHSRNTRDINTNCGPNDTIPPNRYIFKNDKNGFILI